ncbi:MAG: 30S ribosomal protein S21 [Saprospiraceae bacterium]|nr:30S ribosomal protein S21 [Saprospiraceae bacterium]MCF8250557.1 30S ribosomal protein S21 [Saprospiraceae bacterium]MCF8279697.1 30S ribosomal protein S21 [Bacteroidales bacterium]MCF8312483.1 30S ribosomal protein S21 [Saprospiraceae bacterium]MCF8440700.1 30S ribosomal protein S21 [Saprospiraceae bacterium]
MIVVNVKSGESIDKAIRRYRRKYRDVGVRKELMERKQYTKPSVKKRHELLKAVYREKKLQELEY